jgi:hypothetical protein
LFILSFEGEPAEALMVPRRSMERKRLSTVLLDNNPMEVPMLKFIGAIFVLAGLLSSHKPCGYRGSAAAIE